jgi:hypothetical protein
MMVRVFTVEEANRLLPEIECSIQVMRAVAARIMRLRDELSVLEVIGADGAQSPERPELLEKRRDLAACESAIRSEGGRLAAAHVILRDLASGLVDFPARHRDRLVYLCWRCGEPAVRFWHETHAGAAGRRPVSELDREAGLPDGRGE